MAAVEAVVVDQRSFPFVNSVVVVISEAGAEGMLPEDEEMEAIVEVVSVVEDGVTLAVTSVVEVEVVEEAPPESKAPESLRMSPLTS